MVVGFAALGIYVGRMSPILRIAEGTWGRSSTRGVVFATARVTNLSDTTVTRVSATVDFYAADGTVVATGTAWIRERFLGPGGTSDFEVTAPYDARIASARLRLITEDGRTLKMDGTLAGPARHR